MAQRPTPTRRAEPPRPSLLLGSVDACRAELAKLRAAGAALADDAPAAAWAPLVHRYRWLRETLVSQHAADGDLAATAFAAAADAALRAGDWGEFLKAAGHLARGGRGAVDPDAPAPSDYARGEADALLLLYFACVPPRPEPLDAATRLRSVVRSVTAQHGSTLPPAVTSALTIVSAVLAGDALTFNRLITDPAASWRARALASALAPRAHARALATLAATYRSLPANVAARLMATDGAGLKAAVVAASEGAAWAKAWLETEGDLKFK